MIPATVRTSPPSAVAKAMPSSRVKPSRSSLAKAYTVAAASAPAAIPNKSLVAELNRLDPFRPT